MDTNTQTTDPTEGEARCIEQGINVALLRQVAERIQAHPKAFNMNTFCSSRNFYNKSADRRAIAEELENECGTVACIAGWVVVLEGAASNFNTAAIACSLLGIDDEQENRLFGDDGWPEPFRSEYGTAEKEANRLGMADVAAARIEHFIQSGGTE